MEPLAKEGTAFELLAVTGYDPVSDWPTWEDRAAGFDQVTFPVMPDRAGVYYLYAADDYDAVLIDKQGRLVRKDNDFAADELLDAYKKKIRELNVE